MLENGASYPVATQDIGQAVVQSRYGIPKRSEEQDMRTRQMFAVFAGVCVLMVAAPIRAGDDSAPLNDPTRPVTHITRTSFTLQYFTQTPCETRVQVRESDIPMIAWRPEGKKVDLWAQPGVREVQLPGRRQWHTVTVDGLNPGRRYYYRIYDPGAVPTPEEKRWGAQPPWRREYAVSTQAPKGYKTIIHVPVKVLLMPNVVNVASAHDSTGAIAPRPQKLTPQEIEIIKQEYATASRFFWVNSGMRLWIDFQIFIDDRWQRWGPEPENVDAFYKGWPVCRSYPGEDFRGPGGGEFTILDTKDIRRTNTQPVYEERPYPGQIEQAFPRRWNPRTQKWEFYGSGGGTFGVDGLPDGVPARSQFLGGGDTAWLVTHEFHHQMESFGAFSLANRPGWSPMSSTIRWSRSERSRWRTAKTSASCSTIPNRATDRCATTEPSPRTRGTVRADTANTGNAWHTGIAR